MEYKYLSDGRKVVVIGQLNNVESIVQEIFITESGDQVPSGEKFTTKSLHDEPVKSYKAKEEERIEKRILDIKSQELRAVNERDAIFTKLKAVKELFKQSTALSNNLDEEKLETLTSFLSGTVKYIVYEDYGMPSLVDFMTGISAIDNWNGRRSFEGIKLINILGRSDGDLHYRINRYPDGSGSSGDMTAYPFNTIEDAIKKIKEIVRGQMDKGRFPDFRELKKFTDSGVSFDKKMMNEIKKHMIERTNKNIVASKESNKKIIQKYEAEIKEIKANFK